MKKILINVLFASAVAGLTGCADLGFGVDVGSGGVDPYWYGNTYFYPTPSWDGPYWSGPVLPGPPLPPVRPSVRPPLLNPGVGPAIPERPSTSVRPGTNRVPTQVDGVTRPGNGGLANPKGAMSPRVPR